MTKKEEETALAKLNEISEKYAINKLVQLDRFERLVATSKGIMELRKALDPIMPYVLPMAGSTLGFRTDKDDKGGYKAEEVRDCLIEATMRGLSPIGNEFNIIAGRLYTTREGFTRLLREYPGLTDLEIKFGVPKKHEAGAVVDCVATWKLNGEEMMLEAAIPVRVNMGMGADAILGKAERKMKSRIYNMITGTVFTTPEGEVEEVEVIDVEVRSLNDEVTERLEAALRERKEELEEKKPEPKDVTPAKEMPGTLTEEMAKLDAAAIKRINKAAKDLWPIEYQDKIKWWTNANYDTTQLAALPLYAETEILGWIKRAAKKIEP